MQRLVLLFTLSALALGLAGTASAKPTQITVTNPAAVPVVGNPWTLTVHVALRGKPYARTGYRPTLYLVNTNGSPIATFYGVRIRAGTFHVRVVFPHAGTWRYVIADPLNGEWSFSGLRVRA
jgi:hypothetical protein